MVLRRLCSGLFACALALAAVAAAPSAGRAPGDRWVAAEQLIAAQPARSDARLGRVGEARVIPGAGFGLPLALLPARVDLAGTLAGPRLSFACHTSRIVSAGTPAWSARAPPA